MKNIEYQENTYPRSKMDDKVKDTLFRTDKRGFRKTIQRESVYDQNFLEKEMPLSNREVGNSPNSHRGRSRSPYYRKVFYKNTQKRYPIHTYEENFKKRAETSPCAKHNSSASMSQKSASSSIFHDRTYNSHSPRFDDFNEKRKFNKTPHSRSNSADSYEKSQRTRYYSSKKSHMYFSEYYDDRRSQNMFRRSRSPSFENKHPDYQKTYDCSGKWKFQNSSSSFLTSSYNHSLYKSKYESDCYNSKFIPREKYKSSKSSISYSQEKSGSFYRSSHTFDMHQKYKHFNSSRNPTYRYAYDKGSHYKSSFSGELDENNLKDKDILCKDSDLCEKVDDMMKNSQKYQDISRDSFDYNNTKNMEYCDQLTHEDKKLYNISDSFNKKSKATDFKENVVDKQGNTVDVSENKRPAAPIISFKLSNPKSVQHISHVNLEDISGLNTGVSFDKTQESKKMTAEDLQSEVKSSKRSLNTYSSGINNENRDSSSTKKLKKSPENVLLEDLKNIDSSEMDNIQQCSENLEKQSVSITKPITKITMIDSKEGYIYERIGQVGEGTYGKVYKARNKITNELVALKKIRMEYEKNGFPITAMREIKLLQSLKHPNVVCLLEMMVEKSTVYMVFEYMDHDLSGVLSNPNFQFELSHTKHLCKQMLDGLEYLHHRGVLHRDIKGSNILLDNFGQLKLADFGLARYYHKKRDTADYTNRVITLWFRPPELLLGATAYGPSVDIWSAGCIMIELFTKKPLFPGHDEIHQLELIYDMMGTPTHENWPTVNRLPWYELLKPSEKKIGKFYDHYSSILSPAALNLISNILALDPLKRPTASEALKHSFFTQEEPKPEPPLGLGNMKGDWHEYESKRRRKKLREHREIDENKEIEKNIEK